MGIGIVRLFSLVLFFVLFFQLNDCEARRRRGESFDEVQKQIQIGNTFPTNRFSNFWEFNPDIAYRWRKISRIQSISPDLRISNNTSIRSYSNDQNQIIEVDAKLNRLSLRLEYNYGYNIYNVSKFEFNTYAVFEIYYDRRSFQVQVRRPELHSRSTINAGILYGIRFESVYRINKKLSIALSTPIKFFVTRVLHGTNEDPMLDERFRQATFWSADTGLYNQRIDLGLLIHL